VCASPIVNAVERAAFVCRIIVASSNTMLLKKHDRATTMHVLELKVPPPAIAILTAALMWVCAWAVPAFGFAYPARDLYAVGLAVAGAVTDFLCIVSFVRARTTINPMKPASSSSLVVSGLYKLTRNPMYLGLLLILLGWGIHLSNALAFFLLPAFILYMNRFQIVPEERVLATLFGQEFAVYKSRVRRWL
jgi:protein-S-isoprenylcysteine O-methyltransferase Ste14